jgi:ubiquinone/menaquinone biosynthesis C-methylase UbiE
LEATNDALRGKGSFAKAETGLAAINGLNIRTTLSMVVHPQNHHQMADIVWLAANYNVANVHYMWLLATGRASGELLVPIETLFENLVQCHAVAEKNQITIDNIANLSAQVFSTPGTKYDLCNAGWESLAIGPDGIVYPTPALVGQEKAACGHVTAGLSDIWQNSPELSSLRNLSVLNDTAYAANPLKYIIGGGDIDLSFYAGGNYVGHDPYVPLYSRLALWLMIQSAQLVDERPWPQIRRKMGEKLLHCIRDGEAVSLTHSNCVLTFADTHGVVGDFYSSAAKDENTDITNPVCYPIEEMSHIPQTGRIRSYGCGSPVLDATVKPGETVVDLGSGAGVECYIAARKVGAEGSVIGIDMLDKMLALARQSIDDVAVNLGYRNVTFKKGILEQLPIDDCSVDVVISNCVINLSEDKRQTFAEIWRILKPGGRIVISDVVTDAPCPPVIQNDAKFRGECLAGALVQPQLTNMLESAGFSQIRVIKRFFYRKILEHQFYSITYTAFRPLPPERSKVLYPGPYAAVMTDDGTLLLRGQTSELSWPNETKGSTAIFKLDSLGNVANIKAVNTCCSEAIPSTGQLGNDKIPSETTVNCDCFAPPEDSASSRNNAALQTKMQNKKFRQDCMQCGKPLVYLPEDRQEICVFCGKQFRANAVCENGHFVCDCCHGNDMLEVAKYICTHTNALDMIDLINQLRSHPSFSIHGPDHHFVLPGVITAVYKNLGGELSDQDIINAIDRGQSVPGGVCAFWGTCGAAIGAGIAFGIVIRSTPYTPSPRQIVQQVTETVINRLNQIQAARCCQREVWTTLKTVAELSEVYLPVTLNAQGDVQCRQHGQNRECVHRNCPYFKVQNDKR